MSEKINKGPKQTKNKDGHILTFPVFGRFPFSKWIEWEQDCNDNYNGVRWMKAYADHLKAKHINDLNLLNAKIDSLQSDVSDEKAEVVVTMGGNTHE